MATPVITSVTPDEGLSVGSTFVTIIGTDFNDELSGGTVNVLFDGVPALEGGVVDSTKIIALTPGGTPGATVDVVVENVDPPGPTITPSAPASFTYKLPNLETKRDLSTYDGVTLVIRELMKELRRTVIPSTFWDMHPEYVDADSSLIPEEKQAKAPNLKLVGPTITEDRFYARNGRFNIQTLASDPGVVVGEFDVFQQPVTVRLDMQYVGVGRTKGETLNLWLALTRFFERKPFLRVPFDGVDPSLGAVDLEISPIWEQRGDFTTVQEARHGFYQFEGAFVIRGVQITSELSSQGKDVDGEVTVDPIETL